MNNHSILLVFLVACGLFLLGFFIGKQEQEPCYNKLNKDAIFVLQSVEADTLLQEMILNPTYRLRVYQAEKELR